MRSTAARRGSPIDLADEDEAARLKALIVERADVVIHNLKFGALDKYGLGAEALTAAKPSLVCCNLGAFGNTGPLRDRPGYDPMMQAYSGLMSLLGEDGRPPVRVTASIVDMGSAMWAVIGILSALRERDATGTGGVVDTSLYETSLAWMSIMLAGYLANRELPARHGSGVDMIVPYQAFAARDGFMMVAAGNDNLFRRLAAAIGRPELAEDPRFRTNGDRVVNRAVLVPILADIFAGEARGHWAKLFDAAGIPNGPINSMDQVVADKQTEALGLIQQWPESELGAGRHAAVVRRGPAAFYQTGADARRRQHRRAGVADANWVPHFRRRNAGGDPLRLRRRPGRYRCQTRRPAHSSGASRHRDHRRP